MGNLMKKVFMFILIAGLLIALLRMFNYDPFGVVSWVISWIVWGINGVANFFFDSQVFHEITKKPTV